MPVIQPLSDKVATKVVRIIYAHLGGVNFRDTTKTAKRLKWELNRPLPKSARDEIKALGVELINGMSPTQWRPPSIAIHVNKEFSVKDAVKGIEKPGKGIRVRHMVDKSTIINKLLPYVTAEDDDLSLIELIQVIHDRIKEDLS